MTEPILDHNEAWSVAHYKRANSNMARCYINAINTLRELHGALQAGNTVPPHLAEKCAAIVTKVDE